VAVPLIVTGAPGQAASGPVDVTWTHGGALQVTANSACAVFEIEPVSLMHAEVNVPVTSTMLFCTPAHCALAVTSKLIVQLAPASRLNAGNVSSCPLTTGAPTPHELERLGFAA